VPSKERRLRQRTKRGCRHNARSEKKKTRHSRKGKGQVSHVNNGIKPPRPEGGAMFAFGGGSSGGSENFSK